MIGAATGHNADAAPTFYDRPRVYLNLRWIDLGTLLDHCCKVNIGVFAGSAFAGIGTQGHYLILRTLEHVSVRITPRIEGEFAQVRTAPRRYTGRLLYQGLETFILVRKPPNSGTELV